MQKFNPDNLVSELALPGKEIDYELLFENMPSAFGYCKIIYNNEGKPIDLKILQVNNAIEKIFGMKKTDIIGKKITDVKPTSFKEHPEILEVSGRVAISGKTEEFEIFVKFAKIWLHISIFSPKKGHIIFVIENNTKRKNIEAELKNNLEKFSDLANCLPEIIFEIDLSGKTTYANHIAFETTGFTQDDFKNGLFNLEIFIAENVDKAKKDFETVLTTSSIITNEYVVKKKDGSTFNALVKAAPIKSGDKIVGVRGIMSDITEQKKITEILVFQSQLLEAVGQALIAADQNQIISYWNKGAQNLYGWTAKDVLGKTIFEVLTSEISQKQMKEISEYFNKGKSWSSEIQVKNCHGNMVPAIVTRNPVFNKEGKFIGSISVYTDITDQKNIERKLAGYVEDFALATRKIKDLNEKLCVIASFTRHDVRNKLGVLNGYLYMLKKKVENNETAMKYLVKIDETYKQLLEILDFERVYEQIGSEELVYVNVEKYFAEALSLVTDFKDIDIKCECDGLEVFADSLLRQLLYNLMDNTLKYGKKTKSIKLYCEKEENLLLLIYKDDGEGISDDVRSHLFEKGFGKGSGFGLYMIKRIIETYGWSIEENGKLGDGAKFTIKIPENKFRLKLNT